MCFIPITSMLNGVQGCGFLSHAINLYLPCKQELPLGLQRKQQSTASLQFSFMGHKLFGNTILVDVGKRSETGIRLYLEGKRSNRLAIHLQHLSSLHKIVQLIDDPKGFSTVLGAISVMHPEWEGSPGSVAKSGLISILISHHFTQVQMPLPKPADVNINLNSTVYPGGLPVPVQAPMEENTNRKKLLNIREFNYYIGNGEWKHKNSQIYRDKLHGEG